MLKLNTNKQNILLLQSSGVCHEELAVIYEPLREKTNNLGFPPGPTQTNLYSHRSRLEAGHFGFKPNRNCAIRVAKTKALISCAVTKQLICGFVFAYAYCLFSCAAAQL